MTEMFFHKKFRELDQDGDGLVTIQEMKKALHDIAKELKLVLRSEESHRNLGQFVDFDVFQSYMTEKLSQDSTLYYHSQGIVGRRSTSATALDFPASPAEEEAPEVLQLQLEDVTDLLSRLQEQDEDNTFADFLHRHQPQKASFSTIDIRI